MPSHPDVTRLANRKRKTFAHGARTAVLAISARITAGESGRCRFGFMVEAIPSMMLSITWSGVAVAQLNRLHGWDQRSSKRSVMAIHLVAPSGATPP